MKHVQPEAAAIMKAMPGTHRLGKKYSERAQDIIQAFNNDAQISLINRHIVLGMSVEDRRRAEQVKAGIYRGLAVK